MQNWELNWRVEIVNDNRFHLPMQLKSAIEFKTDIKRNHSQQATATAQKVAQVI